MARFSKELIVSIFLLIPILLNAQVSLGFNTSAKPLEYSVSAGSSFLFGDVDPILANSYSVGAAIRKSINHTISFRFEGVYLSTKGVNDNPSGIELLNQSNIFTGYTNENPWFNAYQFKFFGLESNLLIELTNISPNIKLPKWNIYTGPGLLIGNYNTMLNLKDENGNFYNNLIGVTSFNIENDYDTVEGRNEIRNAIIAHYDNSFESDAPKEVGRFRPGNETSYILGLSFCSGISYQVSNKINLSLEHIFTFTYSDYLDGKVWDSPEERSKKNDNLHRLNLRCSFTIGKSNHKKPLHWQNPWGTFIDNLDDRFAYLDSLNMDSDMDGVVDRFDKEPQSIGDCDVDVNGITLDSDRDGIPDCQDKHPFGESTSVSDEELNALRDSINSLHNYISSFENKLDKFLNASSTIGSINNTQVKEMVNASLPVLFFAKDAFILNEENEEKIAEVIYYLKKYPSLKIEIIGHASELGSVERNVTLSLQRAKSVKDFIQSFSTIEPSRITVSSNSIDAPLVKNVPSKLRLNQRVEFVVR